MGENIKRIIFMGTPEFAVPSMKMLLAECYDVVCVVTKEDKRKGRGRKLKSTPVKEEAGKLGLRVMQPVSMSDPAVIGTLEALKPDAIVTAAYGKILPVNVLEIPPYGCVNVHASLLPAYRGPAPIQRAIMNGEKKTGITVMLMDAGIDTGDILLKEELEIDERMTSGELRDRLAILGAEVLIKALKQLESGKATRQKQNDDEASYAPSISGETGHIDWKNSAVSIRDLIRAMNPQPGAYSFYKNAIMKIFEAEISAETKKMMPGKIFSVEREGFLVSCGESALKVTKLQMPGKRTMHVSDYLNGNCITEGTLLE